MRRSYRGSRNHSTIETFKRAIMEWRVGYSTDRKLSSASAVPTIPSITLPPHDKYRYMGSSPRPAIRFLDLGLFNVFNLTILNSSCSPASGCCESAAVLAQDGWWAMWESRHCMEEQAVEQRRLGSNRPRAKVDRGCKGPPRQRGAAWLGQSVLDSKGELGRIRAVLLLVAFDLSGFMPHASFCVKYSRARRR